MGIDLSIEEKNLLARSVQNCVETCKERGAGHDCQDCEKLQGIINKL